MQSATGEVIEFRYSRGERYRLGFVLSLLGVIMLMMAGLAAELMVSGAAMAGLFLLLMTLFSAAVCRIVVRDFTMRATWRIALGRESGAFHLPVWRTLLGPEPSLSGTLDYSAIAAIEWREESARTLGLGTINRVYAIRLKSGGVVILGEDRPVPDTHAYTTLAGEAARALARRAGVGIRQLPMAEGRVGFLTLLGTARAPWPEGGEPGALSAADEYRIRRAMAITQLLPIAAFAALVLAHLLG